MTLQSAFIETDRVQLVHAIGHRDPESPRKLDSRVPRDLETIVLKAITKEPSRRYARAEDLEEDLSRFLLDRPIAARRASGWERTWRWCRRNPTVASLAAALGLILGASLVGLTGLYLNADSQRQRAEGAEENWRLATEEARQGEAKARKSEADTKAVLEFFEKQILAPPRPKSLEGGTGRETTIRAAVDRAEPEIARTFAGQPLVEASIREAVGNTYSLLGEMPRAIQQHERALALRKALLAPDDPYTLSSIGSMAHDYLMTGRLTEALKLHQENLALRKTRLGPAHPKTLISMNRLAETLQELGRLTDAIPVHEEVFRLSKATLGPERTETLYYMSRLGTAYKAAGRLDEALPLLEKANELQSAKLGTDHLDTIETMNQLALVKSNVGRVAEALNLWEEALRNARAALGPDAGMTLALMNNVASAYEDNGRLPEAIPLYEEAIRLQKAKNGPDNYRALAYSSNLAGAYREAGRLAKALALFTETMKAARAKLGSEKPLSLMLMNYTADCLLKMKKFDEAAPLLQECLALRSRKDAGDWWVFQTKSQFGQALTGLKKYSEAEPLLLEAHAGLTKRKAKMQVRYHRYIGEAARGLVDLYSAWGKEEQAASWRQKLPLPAPSKP
jgi:eukaryotic-like serine/threonine-protein kinase